MMEFYPILKQTHMGLAMLSGGIFAIRGLFLLAGAQWPRTKGVRVGSYTLDSVMLLAALTLFFILPGEMFANGWLWVKLVLLPLYVALGVMAFRLGRTQSIRLICYFAALLVFIQIYFVARMHHPLGILIYLRALA